MPHQITISGVSGTSQYDVYVCDLTNTYCFLVFSGATIPPSFTFEPVYPLNNVDSLLVKLIDSNNCEIFNYYEC